jgi:hypothetical protein
MTTKYKNLNNKIPVEYNKLFNYVTKKLKEYDLSRINNDTDVEDNNDKNKKKITNPYYDPLFMKLENGKYIEIPLEIQEDAINKWSENSNTGFDLETISNNKREKLQNLEKEKAMEPFSLTTAFMQMIICVIIILIILYLMNYFK